MYALTQQPSAKTCRNSVARESRTPTVDSNEIARFAMGPATANFPIVSDVALPAIITIPGAMNLTGDNTEIAVIMTPILVNRNSAHNPCSCATNLWESSCSMNPAVNIPSDGKAIVRLEIPAEPSGIDKPTAETRTIPTITCMISVELNQNVRVRRGGLVNTSNSYRYVTGM